MTAPEDKGVALIAKAGLILSALALIVLHFGGYRGDEGDAAFLIALLFRTTGALT